jgi:hypothetical protein
LRGSTPPISASSSATCGASRTIPSLSAYLKRLIALPAFRETFNLDHIKRGYYSIKSLNPTRIAPLGPELDWARRCESAPGLFPGGTYCRETERRVHIFFPSGPNALR